MTFSQITLPEDNRIQKIFESYCTTFPEDERRDWDRFVPLFGNPKVKIVSVINNDENVGYLIYWELSNFIFLEHFEVFQEFRNLNLGSKILTHLFENFSKIILEIEPEDLNEDAKRRYSFYQRNGFHLIDDTYIQPSYGEGKQSLPLWLLANFSPENTELVKAEIHQIVYQ